MAPIKRHDALVQFSREHHFGLLLGWKIRQGIKKEVEIDRMKKYITAAWEAEINPHFLNEEKELFVLLKEEDPLRIQAENEHFDLREKIATLENISKAESLVGFATALDEHIRFEERVLFPHIEQQQTFEAYATAMAKHNDSPHENFDNFWSDHFWI